LFLTLDRAHCSPPAAGGNPRELAAAFAPPWLFAVRLNRRRSVRDQRFGRAFFAAARFKAAGGRANIRRMAPE
jgi:hypothetical protein